MAFQLSNLLYRTALLQKQIDAENKRARPDWLRVMRLKTLRLKLMERLHALSIAAQTSVRSTSLRPC